MPVYLKMLMNAFPFIVLSHVCVVPTCNPESTLLSDTLSQRLSELRTTTERMNDNGGHNRLASIFPGVFKGQPETAWSAALLLLKDMVDAQAKERLASAAVVSEPMPPQLPNDRLVLKDLADLLFKEYGKKGGNGDLNAIITLGKIALEFTPQNHQHCQSSLVDLANLLSQRFNKEGRGEDLDESMTLKRRVLGCMSPDDPQKGAILLELDDYYSGRFDRSGSLVDLEESISLRRDLLESTPPNRGIALLKLASALHERFRRLDLISDIGEAIVCAQVAFNCCTAGQPDHTLSRDRLASYLEVKVSRQATFPRAIVRGADPSHPDLFDMKRLIMKAVFDVLEQAPLRLLHTPTGVLCSRDGQLSYFENSPQYQELLSLLSSLDSQQLITVIRSAISKYFAFSMLSHRWGRDEPSPHDVEGRSIYDCGGTEGLAKLQQFCIISFRRNLQWAWSDTCCIDKHSSAEIQEAIGSMFSWFRRSSLTIVKLDDVFEGGSFTDSVWFARSWTLQELLAPHTILFYTHDWSLYLNRDAVNHKTDPALLEELQKVAGIPKQCLIDFSPGVGDARLKLHWASRRRSTRPEDMVYSLFGVFQVHLPVIYGEGVENALGRLLAEIISRSGDVSILDWVGEPSSFNSCFPANLVPYETVPHIPLIPSDPARGNRWKLKRAQKLASNLARLPRAGFLNNKIALPSIVHPVMTARLQDSSTNPSTYTYEIHASRLARLRVTLSVKLDKGAGKYLLLRPWHSEAPPTRIGSDDHAVWELLEQLRQPFNALLLEILPKNEYRRIASDSLITAYPADLNSVLDSQVLVADII
ncbi:hypothetical protein EDD15DRAFT_721225 [Pisolithus albus]|nr:hypothetical protein EDD15DRAFT_721225 [Pisolithus albus]